MSKYYENKTEAELREVLASIPKRDLAHALHMRTRGRLGFVPGSFSTALYHAIENADMKNKAKLRLGFPGYVDAYEFVRIGENERQLAQAYLKEPGNWD